nr:hypothetical protein [Chloroflexota bacterium]
VGPGVEVIDPAPAVARQVRRVLVQQDLLNPQQGRGRHVFYTSGELEPFAAMVEKLVGTRGEVRSPEQVVADALAVST